MKRVLKLNGKKPSTSVGVRKEKIIKTLTRLGANRSPVDFTALKKACRSVDAKVLRAHLRDLRDMKVVSIRRAA